MSSSVEKTILDFIDSIKEGYSEKQAESFLPKAVKPNLRWLQFFSVSSVYFMITY